MIVYLLTIFTSALLLFMIQPMFARMILPMLGGAPAVWNTAVVFYQAALLGGYAYAHASTRWMGVRRQSILHLCLMLLAILSLPIGVPAGWKPPSEANPAMWVLALLTVAVGLPFFVVSATSPLLQRWFAATGHKHSSDPYFLYAASNMGSMLALLAYPSLIEPALRLKEQGWWWSVGYGALVVMMTMCVIFTWRSQRSRVTESNPDEALTKGGPDSSPPRARSGEPALGLLVSHPRLRWILLAFVPSSLMISVNTYMTTDIAAVPLLWVIPLSLYLLTFILVFARRPILPHSWMVKAMPFVALPVAVALGIHAFDPIAFVMPLHLVAFFVIAMVCHGELARSRPPANDLTQFYLYLSIGGVLGGSFNALIAPLIFKGIAEYPIGLTLACVLLPWSSSDSWKSRSRLLDFALPVLVGLATAVLILRVQAVNPNPGVIPASIMFGLPAMLCLSFLRRPLRFALSLGAILAAATLYTGGLGYTLYAERSFFGVTRVSRDYSGQLNQILHGSTVHGGQWIDPALRRTPTVYYCRTGPLGQFFGAFKGAAVKNVAVVGLGSGGICCYAKPDQQWTYYEIDPAVERIAKDSRFFTYLKDCESNVNVVMGDGRLSLAAATDGAYDTLIMDAYNSDSVPVHLLTREALQLYLKKLAPRGVMIFHISNRYLDLEPVLANLARDAGLCCRIQNDFPGSRQGIEVGRAPSRYLIMARTAADFGALASDPRWVAAATREGLGLWTDDYSSILKIVKWHR